MATRPYLFLVEDFRRTALEGIHGLTITPRKIVVDYSLEQTTRGDTYALEIPMARFRLLSGVQGMCSSERNPYMTCTMPGS